MHRVNNLTKRTLECIRTSESGRPYPFPRGRSATRPSDHWWVQPQLLIFQSILLKTQGKPFKWK